MNRLLAVDPGKRTGFALFESTTLVRCGTVKSSDLHMLPDADELVIEVPRSRRRHPRPNDVLDLALLAGKIVGRYPKSALTVAPEKWKGQLPKDVCWKRVRACLWPDELQIVDAPLTPLDHNARDAIGIGLWHLGRFGR